MQPVEAEFWLIYSNNWRSGNFLKLNLSGACSRFLRPSLRLRVLSMNAEDPRHLISAFVLGLLALILWFFWSFSLENYRWRGAQSDLPERLQAKWFEYQPQEVLQP